MSDLNVRLDTIKLLEENCSNIFQSLSYSNGNKWETVKFKNFCSAKEIINKTKS